MKLLNIITNIYLYFIFVIFILLIDNTGYYNILEFKWNIYIYVSVIYILVIFIISIFRILNHSIIINEIHLSKIHLFALAYIFIIIISCLLSPYKGYNIFIGSSRMQGLIVNIIYVISFIVVSLTYKFDKKIIYVILIPSIIMSILIILQKLEYNPFNIYKDIKNDIFYGTIGNVDTIGLLYTMYIVLGISLYIFIDKIINKFYIFISIVFSLIVMIIINVLNMYVTLLIIMFLLLPIIVLNSKYLKRYLFIFLIIIFVSLFKYYNYWHILLLAYTIIGNCINRYTFIINAKYKL